MSSAPISTLFLDLGGVLLSDGWNTACRKKAAETFALDAREMEERHHLTFDTYEVGKLSLDGYLERVVFYESRPFTMEEFRRFIFSQSYPFPDMIELIRKLKEKYGLKLAVLSNEGREIQIHRIQAFDLPSFIDYFIVSSFVHLRKPDEDIYRLALDVSQTPPGQCAYIEDRPMFVDVARKLGIQGICHRGYATTKAALAGLSLSLESA
ncbi:HAD superfamily hydrolase [Methylacidimicrobium sp. AP8]|uniref:HAD family hydrolase n=1 Tax=Methylacidimicrobium sp. AP8 TaxID=2730359 RepID=UPI0018C0813F|nr:HAD family phosphatase [Methylacidimicrobium sp. AP8]CAB4244096.1 HAD superfamily hydrolase [Methylacidimicrobium sp. AP8]